MLIGAGRTAELAAKALLGAGVTDLTVANRSLCNARRLADSFCRWHDGKVQARAIDLADIPAFIAGVDLVISSTHASQSVLTHADLAGVLAGLDRPLLMIDIAVPRDIDPRLGAVPNVVLRNIDDLRSLVADGLQRRRREIPRARAIVAEEVARFSEWAAATEEQ